MVEPGTYKCPECGDRHKWKPGQAIVCPKAKKRKGKREESPLQIDLANQIEAARLPTPEREYMFHPVRKWRADFAWPNVKVLVEVDGGAFTGGRHTRGDGYTKDCTKLNAAAVLGWTVLRFTSPMLRHGDWEESEAIKTLREAFRAKHHA